MTFIKLKQDLPGQTREIWINSEHIISISRYNFNPCYGTTIQHGSIIRTININEYFQDIYETPEEIVELIKGESC